MRNEKETLRNEIHKAEGLQNDQSIQLKESISKLNFELKTQKENFKQFKNKSEKVRIEIIKNYFVNREKVVYLKKNQILKMK